MTTNAGNNSIPKNVKVNPGFLSVKTDEINSAAVQ